MRLNKGLKIMKTFICKIPPNLPLPSGSASGSWGPPARRETALGRRPKGGAAVQSRITHFKPGIGTLAPDGIILLRQFIKSPLFPPAYRQAGFAKGGNCYSPLWPPAHRASLRGMSPSGAEPDPEGKEGLACLLPVCRSLGAGRKPRRRQGEIF